MPEGQTTAKMLFWVQIKVLCKTAEENKVFEPFIFVGTFRYQLHLYVIPTALKQPFHANSTRSPK